MLQRVAVAVPGGPLMTLLLLALVGQPLVKVFRIWHLQSHPGARKKIKRKKDANDGWGPPPNITPDPADVWGKNLDDRDPLGSAGIALVA